MLNVTTELHRQGHELHLLCLNTRKHYVQPEKLPPLFHELASFHAVGIDTDIKASDAFRNLFKKESYHIVRFYSTVFEQELWYSGRIMWSTLSGNASTKASGIRLKAGTCAPSLKSWSDMNSIC